MLWEIRHTRYALQKVWMHINKQQILDSYCVWLPIVSDPPYILATTQMMPYLCMEFRNGSNGHGPACKLWPQSGTPSPKEETLKHTMMLHTQDLHRWSGWQIKIKRDSFFAETLLATYSIASRSRCLCIFLCLCPSSVPGGHSSFETLSTKKIQMHPSSGEDPFHHITTHMQLYMCTCFVWVWGENTAGNNLLPPRHDVQIWEARVHTLWWCPRPNYRAVSWKVADKV